MPAALDLHSYKAKLAAVRATLSGGITAVSADQLFPTPALLAERLVREARIEPGNRILEPEAGTAAILRAIVAANVPGVRLTAVEIDARLATHLQRLYELQVTVVCADFLQTQWLELFDRIITNPPFAMGRDVQHVRHSLRFLAPRGALAAVMCDDGQAFRPELTGEDGHGRRAARVAELRDDVAARGLIMRVQKLPDGTFQCQGTGVRTALVTIECRST
jgi:hypothetical protein